MRTMKRLDDVPGSEVRVGDEVERSWVKDGVETTVRGTVRWVPTNDHAPIFSTKGGTLGEATDTFTVWRDAPEFPTAPGTVVLIHGADGVDLPEPLLCMVDGDGDVVVGALVGTPPERGNRTYIEPDRVTAWQAVEVTPVGEVIRR